MYCQVNLIRALSCFLELILSSRYYYEYRVWRTWYMWSICDCLRLFLQNIDAPPPVSLFELGDVAIADARLAMNSASWSVFFLWWFLNLSSSRKEHHEVHAAFGTYFFRVACLLQSVWRSGSCSSASLLENLKIITFVSMVPLNAALSNRDAGMCRHRILAEFAASQILHWFTLQRKIGRRIGDRMSCERCILDCH